MTGSGVFAPDGAVVLAGLFRAICGMPDGAHGRAGRNVLGGHPEGEGAAFHGGDIGDAHDEQRLVHRGVSSDGDPPPRGPGWRGRPPSEGGWHPAGRVAEIQQVVALQLVTVRHSTVISLSIPHMLNWEASGIVMVSAAGE